MLHQKEPIALSVTYTFDLRCFMNTGHEYIMLLDRWIYNTILKVQTLDLRSLSMLALVRMAADLDTSTIIFTVGTVVVTFCGCGGRIVTGTQPANGDLYQKYDWGTFGNFLTKQSYHYNSVIIFFSLPSLTMFKNMSGREWLMLVRITCFTINLK